MEMKFPLICNSLTSRKLTTENLFSKPMLTLNVLDKNVKLRSDNDTCLKQQLAWKCFLTRKTLKSQLEVDFKILKDALNSVIWNVSFSTSF